MSSFGWILLARCSTTLLEQREAHFYVHSLCNQKQSLMPECIMATDVSSAGTQHFEMRTFQIFQDAKRVS